MGKYFRTLVSPRRRPVAAPKLAGADAWCDAFRRTRAPSLARHSDRTKGQSPVDLGSSGRPVSAAAVVQPPNVTDSTQS